MNRHLSHAELAAEIEAAIRRSHRHPPVDPPLWLLDQHAAAEAEALRLLRQSGERMQAMLPGTRQFSREPDPPTSAALMAALLRCRPCCHLKTAPMQPSVANLNRGVVRCLRCSRTVLKPIVDDRCEICGSTGNDTFRPAMIQVSAVLVAAEVAPCCWWLLGEVAA